MRPLLVEFITPGFGDLRDVGEAFEKVHFEHLGAIRPVKSSDQGILCQLAGLNDFQVDSVLLRPIRQADRDEFRTIVQAQLAGIAPRFGDSIEHSDDAPRGKIEINLDSQSLSIEVIDRVEGA